MCHYSIGETFHKVAFHMATHERFVFVRVRIVTCQTLIHQDSIFMVLVHVSILGF